LRAASFFLSMQTSLHFRRPLHSLALAASISGLLFSAQPALLADAGKHARPGAAGHAAGHATTDVAFPSTGAAWATVQAALDEIDTLVAAKNLKAVHPVEEKVSAALKYLDTNSGMVTDDKAKRLKSALTQALALSGNVHSAADADDAAKTVAEVKKLRAGLKLVEAQYPADALKAPAGFVQYQCAMKDFTGDKPGDCPKCGMKLKAVVPAMAGGEHAGHGDGHTHGAKAPTMALSFPGAQPLTVGKKANVTLRLAKKDGSPVLPEDLEVAHTKKIHLLIIDPSLTDYHHEHPEPAGRPGEYAFSFTPQKPGPYRVWADLVPTADKEQEYVIADLPADTKAEPVPARAEAMTTKIDDLTYTLTFKGPIKVGDAALGTLTITDAKGNVFPGLEPIMGAYAHLVGFSEDYKTIAHIHPMGEEPTKETDRGAGKLDFHIAPEQPGTLRLFAQVQIGGVSKFAPFTLNIQK
jgi:hypothetical protein